MKDKVAIYVWPNGSWAFESKIKNLDLYLLETGKFKNFTIHHIPKELSRDEICILVQNKLVDVKTEETAKIYIWPDGTWEYVDEIGDLDLYLMETGKSDDFAIHYVPEELNYDEVDNLVQLMNRFV
jgi:hypothetical protein